MSTIANFSFYLPSVAVIPPLTVWVIRKTKARLQNRLGPSVMQPFFDLWKLCQKQETLSESMSGMFRWSTIICFAIVLFVSGTVPWLGAVAWQPNADIFFVVYLLALARVLTLLGALDAGSAFGALGASREATLSLLVEPALIVALVAIAITAKDSNLNHVFALTGQAPVGNSVVWLCAGVAILAAGLVEQSRLPVDDPTTHLELTMIHEAMILEASARNLALIQFTQCLKLAIYFGLSGQCFLRATPAFWHMNSFAQTASGPCVIFAIAGFVGVLESLIVKLQWRKIPEFVTYILTISLAASFVAMLTGLKQ